MRKVFFFIIVLLLLACGKDESPTAETRTYSMRFEVNGLLGTVDIDYSDGRTAQQRYNLAGAELPWKFAFYASSRDAISVRARIRTGISSGGKDVSYVVATAYMDGQYWKSNMARGQGATAQVSEKLP